MNKDQERVKDRELIRELVNVLIEYLPLGRPLGASNQALYDRALAILEKAKQP